VDGDGKSEIIQTIGIFNSMDNTTSDRRSAIARFDTTSRTFSTTPIVIAPTSSSGVYADMLNFTAQPGDFNGDGLVDLYSVTSSPSDSSWYLTGAPADSAVKFRRTLHNRGGFDGGFWVDDFNNDGISDLLTATNCRQTPSQVCSQFRLDVRGPGGAFLTIPGQSPLDIIPGQEFEAKNTAFGDVDGDGTPDILAAHVQNGVAAFANSRLILRRQRPDLLEVIREDAVNESYRIRYEGLSNRQAYQSSCTVGTAAQLAARAYPRRCLRGGNAYVVKEYLKDAGPGLAPLSYQYQYENGQLDLQGLGFLGFEKITIDEPARMQKVQLTYNLTRIAGGRCPYLGMVESERRATVPWTGGAVEMTFTEHELATRVVGPTYFPYVRRTTSKTYVGGSGLDPAGPFGTPPAALANLTPVAGEIRSITMAAGADEIDDYGNEIGVLYDHFDGETKTVRTDYLNDVASWTIRRPLWQTTTQRVRDGRLATVNTNRTWNVVTGALRTSERDLLSRNVYPRRIETTYEPDIYGNIVSVTDRDAAGRARATSSVYDDPEHMYPQRVTNAAGHVVQQRYHAQLGVLVISVGSNGETTRMSYDGLGRLRKTEYPNGTLDETEYLGGPSAAGNVAYQHLEHAPGQPDKRIDFDRLNRPIASTRAGFDGTALIKRRTYDRLGRLATESLPAAANAVTTSWRMAYSNLDRMTSKTSPDGQVTSYSGDEWSDHDGRTGGRDPRQITGRVIQQTNPRGLRTWTFTNGQGHVEQVTDQHGNITRYGYGPFGPETITDARGNVITVQYDLYGRRRTIIDPDMGTRTYTYTTFAEPYTEVDANGNTTTFTYDTIGRRDARRHRHGRLQQLSLRDALDLGHRAARHRLPGLEQQPRRRDYGLHLRRRRPRGHQDRDGRGDRNGFRPRLRSGDRLSAPPVLPAHAPRRRCRRYARLPERQAAHGARRPHQLAPLAAAQRERAGRDHARALWQQRRELAQLLRLGRPQRATHRRVGGAAELAPLL
jgi:YD repeat-containing protein